jgi:hypothetical protein
MKRNKKNRTFKYITEEPIIFYRSLDKTGAVFVESEDLNEVVAESGRLGKEVYEKMEIFEVTNGYQSFKPKMRKKNHIKPSPTGRFRSMPRVRRRGYIRRDFERE